MSLCLCPNANPPHIPTAVSFLTHHHYTVRSLISFGDKLVAVHNKICYLSNYVPYIDDYRRTTSAWLRLQLQLQLQLIWLLPPFRPNSFVRYGCVIWAYFVLSLSESVAEDKGCLSCRAHFICAICFNFMDQPNLYKSILESLELPNNKQICCTSSNSTTKYFLLLIRLCSLRILSILSGSISQKFMIN